MFCMKYIKAIGAKVRFICAFVLVNCVCDMASFSPSLDAVSYLLVPRSENMGVLKFVKYMLAHPSVRSSVFESDRGSPLVCAPGGSAAHSQIEFFRILVHPPIPYPIRRKSPYPLSDRTLFAIGHGIVRGMWKRNDQRTALARCSILQ